MQSAHQWLEYAIQPCETSFGASGLPGKKEDYALVPPGHFNAWKVHMESGRCSDMELGFKMNAPVPGQLADTKFKILYEPLENEGKAGGPSRGAGKWCIAAVAVRSICNLSTTGMDVTIDYGPKYLAKMASRKAEIDFDIAQHEAAAFFHKRKPWKTEIICLQCARYFRRKGPRAFFRHCCSGVKQAKKKKKVKTG
jgi:hypothetical protein